MVHNPLLRPYFVVSSGVNRNFWCSFSGNTGICYKDKSCLFSLTRSRIGQQAR